MSDIFWAEADCHLGPTKLPLVALIVCLPAESASLRSGIRELLVLERHRSISCGVRSFFEERGEVELDYHVREASAD